MKRLHLKWLSLIAVTVILTPAPLYAFSWADLWFTRDQQAAKAMQQGKPKKAAVLFKDENWKGIALYRSGQYLASLARFKKDPSAIGDFNQGNSLAQMGEYQQAIDAYDKALHQKPDFADAKYNKALIEKLLQQQKNDEESSQKNQPDQKNQKNQNNPQHQQNQNNQDSQQNQQNQKNQDKQQNQHQPQSQNGDDQTEQTHQADATHDDIKNPSNAKVKPLTEQEQATEQWLRGIPDDPGGLLKQKFLRDHQRYELNQEGNRT